MRRDKLDEAQSSFERAIELHRQAHSVLGEANDVQSLGDVCISSFERAIELHRQAHNVLGEANDVQSLGDVYLRRPKLDEVPGILRACH
jgi:exonuclease VII small subunit